MSEFESTEESRSSTETAAADPTPSTQHPQIDLRSLAVARRLRERRLREATGSSVPADGTALQSQDPSDQVNQAALAEQLAQAAREEIDNIYGTTWPLGWVHGSSSSVLFQVLAVAKRTNTLGLLAARLQQMPHPALKYKTYLKALTELTAPHNKPLVVGIFAKEGIPLEHAEEVPGTSPLSRAAIEELVSDDRGGPSYKVLTAVLLTARRTNQLEQVARELMAIPHPTYQTYFNALLLTVRAQGGKELEDILIRLLGEVRVAPAIDPAIEQLSEREKRWRALKLGAPQLSDEAREQLLGMLKMLVPTWIAFHAVGVAEVADVIGIAFVGNQAIEALSDSFNYYRIASGARSELDLRIAGEHLAKAIASVGVPALLSTVGLLGNRLGQPKRRTPTSKEVAASAPSHGEASSPPQLQEGTSEVSDQCSPTPEPVPEQLDTAAALEEKILRDCFGSRIKADKGRIVYLSNDELIKKGNLPANSRAPGLFKEGVAYLNRDFTSPGATLRARLYLNASVEVKSTLGRPFVFGITEHLVRKAMLQAGMEADFGYPVEVKYVQALLDGGFPEKSLIKVYFDGTVEELTTWIDRHCVTSWRMVRKALAANKLHEALVGLQPRQTLVTVPPHESADDRDQLRDASANPKLVVHGGLTHLQAQKVLQNCFGDYIQASDGRIAYLLQAEMLEAARDIDPTADSAPGGRYDPYTGTIRINKDYQLPEILPHELLHKNSALDRLIEDVGYKLNEGLTQYLTIKAMKQAGFTKLTAVYVEEVKCIQALLQSGFPEESLLKVYFKGTTQELIAWVDEHCVYPWETIKQAAESGNFKLAQLGLQARKGPDGPLSNAAGRKPGRVRSGK